MITVVLACAGQAAASSQATQDAVPARWLTTATTGAPLGHVPYLSAFRDGTAFVVADGVQAQPSADGAAGLGVLRSKDGGLTWQAPLRQPSFDGPGSLAMADSRNGVFASGRLLSRTVDGAESWTAVAVPPVIDDGAEYATAVDATNGGRTVVMTKDGFEVKDGCPYLLRSTPVQVTQDGGRTWVDRSLPITSYPHRVELAAPERMVLTSYPYEYQEPVRDGDSCSVGGGLLTEVQHSTTTDGGRTWRAAHTCTVPCAATWAGVATLLIVQRDGSVLTTTGGAGAPVRIGQLPGVSADRGQFVHGVNFLDERLGYAAVYGAGTFRTEDGGRTWVLERPEPATTLVGSFADVAAVDGVRAIASSNTGLHARVADPLATVPALPSPGPRASAEDPRAGLRLDGARPAPRRTLERS